MTTSTEPKVKISKADAAFHIAYGHYPSECLRGCLKPKGDHRKSLERPGAMAGKPFEETLAEKRLRRAAKRNGPVTTIAPAAPAKAAKTVAASKAKATPAAALADARSDATDARVLVLEVKMDKILAILERAQAAANKA